MNKHKNPLLTKNAKILRKNMTKEERKLWYEFLKLLPITVNRQKVFGQYIVDFYCATAKLVIELDGSQHYSENSSVKEQERESYLRSLGLKILRYPNNAISNNFKGVCQDIIKHLGFEGKPLTTD